MRNFRQELDEGCCPENNGCNAVRYCMCGLAEEMTEEIDRLRAENEELQARLEGSRLAYGLAANELDVLRPENESLRASNDTQIKDQIIARLIDNFMKQEAEIDRLRAENEQLSERNVEHENRYEALDARNENLRAENERLLALKTPASAELLNITKAALEHAEAEVASLHAEIERLRDTLASREA